MRKTQQKSRVWVRYNGNVIMVVFIKILCSLKWCRAQAETIHIILYDHEYAVISNLDVINICNTWPDHSPLLPPHPPASNFIVFWFHLETTGFTSLAHLRLKISTRYNMNEQFLSMLISNTMAKEFPSQDWRFYSNCAHHTPYFLMPRLSASLTKQIMIKGLSRLCKQLCASQFYCC